MKKDRIELKLSKHEWNWLNNDGKKLLEKIYEYKDTKIVTPSIRKLAKEVNGKYRTVRDRIHVMGELGLLDISPSSIGESKNCKMTARGLDVLKQLNYKGNTKADVDRIIFGPQFDSLYRNSVISIIEDFRNVENDHDVQESCFNSLVEELNQSIERFGNDCYEITELQSFISSIPGSDISRDIKWKAFLIFQKMVKYKPSIDNWINYQPYLLENIYSELIIGDNASICALHLLCEFRDSKGAIPAVIFIKINELIPILINKRDERPLVTTEAIIPVMKSWSTIISHEQRIMIRKTLVGIKNDENMTLEKDRIKKIGTLLKFQGLRKNI